MEQGGVGPLQLSWAITPQLQHEPSRDTVTDEVFLIVSHLITSLFGGAVLEMLTTDCA